MSGSEDDDWFTKDEEEIEQSFQDQVKQQDEQKEEDEQILCSDAVDCLKQLDLESSAGETKASGRFATIELSKALKMLPVDMFLYFMSEDRDLFVAQLAGNDSLKRLSILLEALKSICQLELGGFDDQFLAAFSKQTVIFNSFRRFALAISANALQGKCDAESEQILRNMIWLMARANKIGVLGQQGYELVGICKKLIAESKLPQLLASDLSQELEVFTDTLPALINVKGEIYPTVDRLLQLENLEPPNPPAPSASNQVADYLSTQRHILQQDFFLPLLEFVQYLRAGCNVDGLEERGLLWRGTQLDLNPEFVDAQRHSLVFLNLRPVADSKKIKINRKLMENFKTGALLCLTTGLDFENLILCTVGYTEPAKLNEGLLSVVIVKQYNIGNIYERPLMMFQTPVFFEPYVRVHNYLSTCSTEQFPMRRYIVDGQIDIRPPAYIKPDVKLTYNRKPFTPSQPPQDLILNDRQRNAFEAAYTNEFCIIQGPPGTGKTHVSVELVNSLIQNAKVLGTGPIIVLTYTNDSLDKFLVKASKYTREILRFGCQTRDPQLAKFNANSMLDPELVPPRLKRVWWLVNTEYKEQFQRLQTLYANFDGSEGSYQETLVAQEQLQQVSERLDTVRIIFQYYLARNKDLLAMTTTCAARLNFLFRLLKSKCFIFEEAAEIQEAHILACLTPHTQHVILVGDHKQLQPFTGCSQLSQVSLFERLIDKGLPYSLLNVQYRMRPCISGLLVPSIYEELLCSDSTNAYEDVRLMDKNLFFVSHNKPEKPQLDMSIENIHEAKELAELTEFLLEKSKYEASDIVILSPYNAQVERIKKTLPMKYAKGPNSVQVSTVDSFQGLEANIVLLSLVRSNPSGHIGFLGKPNRACVALSRARWALYIIGNMETLLQGNSELWSAIDKRLKEANAIGEAFPKVV
ncbi:NFX1-type zinc finger-containing protein 1 [Drosophila obscura]|uniref:NFX1-type zinc finger-containing protein 1 n=1 Tax=Drosophila obscura TaxID=7282 RepID=UPI001BB1F32F|nr:NFX1-type zinc finger-containing protein 1 [Drosophila obscura]XP_022224893.2 NFX1-type zinc finger-containing protein 1 [Drosophila obscura]XP_041447504.1 NFX1-type zinc finger-containing protein 1 [Drosophila obscura]